MHKQSLHYLGSSRIVSLSFVGFGKSPTHNVCLFLYLWSYLYVYVYIVEKRMNSIEFDDNFIIFFANIPIIDIPLLYHRIYNFPFFTIAFIMHIPSGNNQFHL